MPRPLSSSAFTATSPSGNTTRNSPADATPDKPALVFLRGLIRSRFHWGTFPRRFDKDFQVIEPERPGNGYLYRDTTPGSIPAMMEAVRAQVRTTTTAPVIIIAVSMGAMIATEWARRYPQEIRQLHLVNTSLANLSLPWQRMKALSFLRLISTTGSRLRLEQTILKLTMSRPLGMAEKELWLDFAEAHPLRWRNIFVQLIASSGYQGPREAPVENIVMYNASGDQLVKPGCTMAIARQWKKPLITHPDAGHDLPMDDPQWLEEKIRGNFLRDLLKD